LNRFSDCQKMIDDLNAEVNKYNSQLYLIAKNELEIRKNKIDDLNR